MLAEAGLSAAELARETARVAASVDALFSSYLTGSGDGRDRLFEAMVVRVVPISFEIWPSVTSG